MNDGPAALVTLEGVGVRFGGVVALDDVSVAVHRGEVVAVIGPNGAGKSTLLNVINGLSRATSGRVSVDGARRVATASVARAGVGRSFQDPRLLERETALTNLVCGAHCGLDYSAFTQLFRRGAARRHEMVAEQRARRLLATAGHPEWADVAVANLPYGPRKLVDTLRAFMSEPRLVLLDEPSSGLDHGEQDLFVRVIQRVREQMPVTIVLVEHNMEVVRQAATRVVGLQAGRVIASGTPTEVLDSEQFRAALIGGHGPTTEVTAWRG